MNKQTASDISQTERVLSALILFVAVVMFGILAYPLCVGQVYVYNDLGHYHLPLRDFYQRCLLAGDNFTWMPSILCGYYVHAEGQAGMYHPFHWLIYRYLPLGVAFNVEFLASFPFMFLGLYLFLRRWHLQRCACLFGALSFTFSGFCLLHSIHMNMIQVIAHIPWLLLALDMAWRAEAADRKTLCRAYVALALLTASQILLGFPQSVYFSMLAEGAYLLFLLGTARAGWGRRVLLFGGAKATAVLLAGIQLMPTFDMMLNSDRKATPIEFRSFFSLHPANLLQFIGPQFFQRYIGMNPEGPKQPHEAGLYAGVIVTLLCVWLVFSLLRRDKLQAAPLARGALALGAFALVLALGRYGGLYPLLAELPLVSAFRSSCRHIVLVHLAMSVLAAIAFNALIRHVPKNAERLACSGIWPLSLPVVLGWLIAGYLVAGIAGHVPLPAALVPFLSSSHEMWIAPFVMTVGAVLLFACLRPGRFRLVALATLVLFAMTDQGLYALRYPSTEKPMTLDEYKTAIAVPPTPHAGRAYGMVNNLMAVRGVDNCTGYIALALNQRFTYEYGHTTPLRLAGVQWADQEWPKLGRPGVWTEITDPMPYVRMLSKTYQTNDPVKDIENVDIATTALTDTPILLPESVPGVAELIEKRPGKIRVRVQASARQLLTVAESWHSGWHAEAEGKPIPVLRVNGDFLGCILEPGTREVCFTFAPQSLDAGKAATAMGGGLLLLTSFMMRRKKAVSAG